MTWLWVRARPDDEITMPVPAASPPLSELTRLTTDGLTFDAIACTSMLACCLLPEREPLELPCELPFDVDPLPPSCGTCCVGKLPSAFDGFDVEWLAPSV